MKQNASCRKNVLTTMAPVVLYSAAILLFTGSTLVQGQQQRFFLPSALNNGNFAATRVQFPEDTEDTELIVPQRRLSSADPLPISNGGSSSFFSSPQQLPSGTFTNSGPFSRQPTAQQFILNGQQAQFQPIRNAGSLSFTDTVTAVPPPSQFQQAPIQRTQQQFNFFANGPQQQRFRPNVQQRPEQQGFTDNFDERQNSQPSLILQPSDQGRFAGDLSRRPLPQTSGIIPAARNPPPTGSVRWWNPSTVEGGSIGANSEEDDASSAEVSIKDDLEDSNRQRQTEQQKRGRGQQQPQQQQQQGRRRPITTPLPPSSILTQEEQQEPAAIGFTVVHDGDDVRSSWSQPIITTHRPQSGQILFRNRNPPAAVSGSFANVRPTTYNPLASPTSIKPLSLQSSTSSIVNKQQPTTVRGRKPSLISTGTTTTESTIETEQEQDDQVEPVEEKRQLLPRRPVSTTSQPTTVPITTLRTANRPRLNSPAAPAPQQQRMKKVVNNPAIVQSIITRKPVTTSTTTLAPTTTTNTNHQVAEEYEEYEDVEYTTTPVAHTTTELPPNKKQTKLSTVTQSSTTPTNQRNNSVPTTESWVVVASVQTSRSVSSSVLSGGTNKNITTQGVITSTAATPTNKHRFNNKPAITTTSTTTVESIIDKLDRVQSELSNGILYGSASNTNNSSSILTDIQSSNNNDDKRSDVIISSFTTPSDEKSTTTTVSATTPTTTTTTSSTTEKENDEEEDKDEEEDSDDSNKETTFVRKFVPSKQRTTTVATATTTSTVKPPAQAGKKKSLIDTVKFDELLTSGLLPPGFNPKSVPAYKSKTITTTTTTEVPSSVTKSVSVTQPSISSSSIDTTTTSKPITSSTTAKSKSSGLKIKFDDDPSAIASLLPPGFKLEETIKPVEILSPALLPPGYKLPAENVDSSNKPNEQEVTSTTETSTTETPSSTTTTTAASSTTGLVFPNSGKVTNNSGTRKPLPSSKKIQASVTLAPVIQKGWPVRATTEFTGWSTPSTTPFSIEKLLSQSKSPDLAAIITSASEASTTTTSTTTTTTMKPPPTTTPGQCSEGDSVCELVGTVRLVGSGSEKWVPELLDHNTAEWRLLANEVESQLDKVYSKSPALSKWYKKITIDSFSPGSNEISNGKPNKNAGVLVDYFVQLNKLGRTVNTADIRRLFHETLQKDENLGSSAQPLQYGNGGDYEGPLLKLGRFTVDSARTDFIVLPKPTRGVTSITGTDDAWLPQWAVAVMVIGLASVLFVLIFGLTVLISRKKNNKKIPPPTIQSSMIADELHQHMYSTGKSGPTTGSRHMMHHPPSHSNSNYNISSYGYDNYAIDDDMMMLDEDDLEDVDRLYDMDAVWTDHNHDHEKLKIPPTSSTMKKHRDAQQHGGHYDSWRSTAMAPQTLTPIQSGYYAGGGGYGYGTDPSGYAGDRRHYHREAAAATNPRSHHQHYPSSHHNANYTSSPRKPPQQYHPDYDTDF